MIDHGTTTKYSHGCRCTPCKHAYGDRTAQRRAGLKVDAEALRAVLEDLFPYGLTRECPRARRTKTTRG